MGKAKTSKKLKAFSIENLKPSKLKVGVKTVPHDPRKNLSDPEFIAKALLECMLDGDVEEFKEILRTHYETVNTTQALRRAGLSKRTFYGALAKDGNPSLETVMKIVAGLKAS